jgi:hypothetical protein
MTDTELLRALLEIDPELRELLISALNDDPEALRATLYELGYGSDSVEKQNDKNGRDITRDERSLPSEGQNGWDPEINLTPAETKLYEVIKRTEVPLTAGEIRDEIKINAKYSEFLDQYSSLENRGWISNKLNKFAKQGLVGKFRQGREVRYTPSIKNAVRNWAQQNKVPVQDLSIPNHSDRIVADMNMNREAVQWAIRSLTKD